MKSPSLGASEVDISHSTLQGAIPCQVTMHKYIKRELIYIFDY